jgi:CRP/FNR family transcriptional regulator, nitrogen oxide reductase regulator
MRLESNVAPFAAKGSTLKRSPKARLTTSIHRTISRPSLHVISHGPSREATSASRVAKSRFLSGLSQSALESILNAARQRRLQAKSVILQQGDRADHFFLLTSGYARLFYITQEGRKVLLRWLAPGEILGGAALLPYASTYLVSTEIVKDGTALVWHRDAIRELVHRYPRLLDNALPYVHDHLSWFLAAQVALVSNSARERLANVLLSLSQGIGHAASTGIVLDITNEQLANAANITPFTTSRLISEWRRNGALVKTRGKILLREPQKLFCNGA